MVEISTVGFLGVAILLSDLGVFSLRISGVLISRPVFFRYIHRGMNNIMAIIIRHSIFIFLAINFAMAAYSFGLRLH